MTSSMLERVCLAAEAMGKTDKQMIGMMICFVLNQKSVRGEVYP